MLKLKTHSGVHDLFLNFTVIAHLRQLLVYKMNETANIVWIEMHTK